MTLVPAMALKRGGFPRLADPLRVQAYRLRPTVGVHSARFYRFAAGKAPFVDLQAYCLARRVEGSPRRW